jgi:hypothetical protein
MTANVHSPKVGGNAQWTKPSVDVLSGVSRLGYFARYFDCQKSQKNIECKMTPASALEISDIFTTQKTH